MSEESTSTRNHVTLAVTNIAVPLECAFSTVRLQVTGATWGSLFHVRYAL